MKQIRVGLGLGQQEVADRVGMPLRRYGSYERGERTLSLADAARIADVFDCSLDELAGRDYRPSPSVLSDDERKLVDIYRDSNPQGRASILAVAEAQPGMAAESSPSPPRPLTQAA